MEPKNNKLFKPVISEHDFFDCLSHNELFQLIITLQNEKRKYFKHYVILMNLELNESEYVKRAIIKEEREKIWKKHLYYEELVQWCMQENIKRTRKRSWWD